MKRLIALCMICAMLSGCAALEALKAIGGGTSSKGHGNDNELLIGSDSVKGISTGTKADIDADNNSGVVTGRDNKTDHVAGNKTVHNSELSKEVLILFLVAILGWILPSPGELWRSFTGLFRRKKDEQE